MDKYGIKFYSKELSRNNAYLYYGTILTGLLEEECKWINHKAVNNKVILVKY